MDADKNNERWSKDPTSDARKEKVSLLPTEKGKAGSATGEREHTGSVDGQQQQPRRQLGNLPFQAWPRSDAECVVPGPSSPPSSPKPRARIVVSAPDLVDDDADASDSVDHGAYPLAPNWQSSSNGSPRDHLVVTRRRCYTQAEMEKTYHLSHASSSLGDVIKEQCRCSARCVVQKLLSFIPIIGFLRTYRWNPDGIADLISGLSVGFLHLPQGLGFGLLASLTPVHGLYSSFFPVLVYMIFGTSPHVSMGTNAVVALLAAGIIDTHATEFQASKGSNETVSEEELMQFKVGIAGATCFIGGLILIAMGLLRLGFLTNFMAKSFIGGFSFAAAVHITVSQVVKLLHLKFASRSGLGKLVLTTIDICENIADTNAGDVVVGILSGVILLAVNIGVNERYKDKLKVPVPIELIVVVLSTFISHFAQLNDRFNINVVGDIPQGMPAPSVPHLDAIPGVAIEAFVTAILIFALTISMGKLTAKLHDIEIDDNQELVAYGLCQVVGSFFQNFSSSISPPRTMMLSSMGAKSTLNNFMSAVFILLILLVAGQLFVSLPIAMLAAMIVVAMKDLLLQVRVLKTLWYINKSDFFIWLLTAVFSIFGDLDVGLLVGVVTSMITVMIVSQRSKGTLLGKSDWEDVILDLERQGVSGLPGVRIFRFESQLHFASAERFKSELYSKICDPTLSSHKDRYEINIESDTALAQSMNATATATTPERAAEEEGENGGDIHFSPASQDRKVSLEMTLSSGAVLKYGMDRPRKYKLICPGGRADGEESASLTKNPLVANQLSELNYVIVDCSTMTYIDITGVDTLHLIITQFSRAGVTVLLTDIPTTTLGILTRAKFFQHEDNRRVYHSVLDALHDIRAIRSTRLYFGIRKSFGDLHVVQSGEEEGEIIL